MSIKSNAPIVLVTVLFRSSGKSHNTCRKQRADTVQHGQLLPQLLFWLACLWVPTYSRRPLGQQRWMKNVNCSLLLHEDMFKLLQKVYKRSQLVKK
ncbi:hypothetical protein ATANTOWER_003400 [Ataeniobius toweri]|uniref:Uncharacterized protein n=1 Tax=Ataeniobius toweri TaxID=208326 RepID=A0ABU7A0U1_9TELE|nr:hypothetical protein [Ataeniobius toweri]